MRPAGCPSTGTAWTYAALVLNTDGVPVPAIIQGPVDQSEGLHNESIVAKANKAIQQIEECQVCGDKGHQA